MAESKHPPLYFGGLCNFGVRPSRVLRSLRSLRGDYQICDLQFTVTATGAERFLKDILFNNAILPFSGKVKLFLHLRAANNWPKIDPTKFHRLMHIRNQFAHGSPNPFHARTREAALSPLDGMSADDGEFQR